jgi:hypothetical protein
LKRSVMDCRNDEDRKKARPEYQTRSGLAAILTLKMSHVPPAKPEAWFVNRSKRFGRLRRHACYSDIFS